MARRTREGGSGESTENKTEVLESFESDVIDPIGVETVKSISKPERDRDFLTDEQRERFVMDSSAEKKLMGSLDGAVESASVAAFKKYILDNPGNFGKKKEEVENLSEEQIRIMMEGDRDKVIDVASRDPRYAEMIHLRETLREAEGDMNYDEKFMFFKRIDTGIIKDPTLLKELRVKLWEAKEGEKIDEKALEIMKKEGFTEEKARHVEEKTKAYRTEKLMKAMGVEVSQITERIDLEKIEGREISEDEARDLIIKEKKDEIKKKTGSNWSDEEIVALFEKGHGLAGAELSGTIFKKIKIGEKKISLKELKVFGKDGVSVVAEDLADHVEMAGKEWDSKFERTKEGIIESSLKEISVDSAKRVYEKYKKIRLFNGAIESRIETNKKNKETFSEMYGERIEEMGEIADELYDCQSLAGFKSAVERLHGNDLKDFIMSKDLVEIAKKKKGNKRFWFESFFNFIAEFLTEDRKSSKKK